ncbi:hypothetical protein ADK35_38015 [Streptomyces viridochromogenes]|nr:hypothetical protein [Streptomyces viridochromogenes]KOG10428.1 hypothetical protein ADK35_38015 [Streptomyces viridochromogenes]KOG10540.1 hypothetical protein ADK36_38815 [Streptomyces viridochromogenes]
MAQEDEARLVRRVDGFLQAGVDAGEQVAQPRGAGGGLLDQRGAVADQEPQFHGGFLGQLDGAQVLAEHDLFGDDFGVARVGLVLSAAGGAAGAVDRQAGHVHDAEAFGQQHRGQQGCYAAEDVQPDGDGAVVGLDGVQFADGLVDGGRVVVGPAAEQRPSPVVGDREPVEVLGDVEACGGGHGPLLVRCVTRLLPPVLALPSDRSQCLISSPEEVAGQGTSGLSHRGQPA